MINRWKAYLLVDKLKLGEMERDYIKNRIVDDSNVRLKGATPARIVQMEFSRLKRCINDRKRVLGEKGTRLLATSIV